MKTNVTVKKKKRKKYWKSEKKREGAQNNNNKEKEEEQMEIQTKKTVWKKEMAVTWTVEPYYANNSDCDYQ